MKNIIKNLIAIYLLTICLRLIHCGPIKLIELNKNWSLRNKNSSISIDNIEIPSGIYSEYSKFIGESEDYVLHSKNDVKLRWLSYDNWIYSCNFDVDSNDLNFIRFINLTFHGLDTISVIKLNENVLGETNNMFVRYTYDVKGMLKPTKNLLEIHFESPVEVAQRLAKQSYVPPQCPPARYNGECHMNYLRKMQASFSWDWGLAAPSVGIWKPITLELFEGALIRDVDVITSKTNGIWTLNARIYLETNYKGPIFGELTFYAVELADKPIKFKFSEENAINDSMIEFSQHYQDDRIERWWPNGYGNQKLYHLHFTFNAWISASDNDPKKSTISQKSVRVGFRTIEIIENELEEGNSFYFKVNGYAMFMKGTNYIPSHILPELGHNQERINHLMEAMKNAHMNMMRVWGGGIYESDYFYDMADQNGILIWQDMMFGCAMYPVFDKFLESIALEVVQNGKRIAHHPSIALIAGNNENEAALVQNWYNTSLEYKRFADEYKKLYVATINHELKIISHSARPEPITSSPSNGKKTIQDGYISDNPQSTIYGDIHHYDYLTDGWDPNIYPNPRFASEYGFQSFPAMSSWKKIMKKSDDLEDIIDHHQHFPMGNFPILQLTRRHLPLPLQSDPDYWEILIYFSQISQAMVTKTETEVYRRERNSTYNTMGALYWQLNDVWIAPSWSSIDYLGNYKILHYWANEFLAPISIIAHYNSENKSIAVYVVRDTLNDEIMDLNIKYNVFKWNDLYPKKSHSIPVKIAPNTAMLATEISHDDIFKNQLNENNCFIEFILENKEKKSISRTYYFPDKIKLATGVTDPKIKIEISSQVYQYPISSISISVYVHAPALFVYLEIDHENVTSYKLTNNGFIQVEPIKILHLEFQNQSRADITEQNIKVLTVNKFMINVEK